MKLKRILAGVVCMCMAITVLAGCQTAKTPSESTPSSKGTTSQSQAPKDEPKGEPTEVSVALWDIENILRNGADDKLLTTIEEGANVKIKPVNITWDDYRQKIQLWASSNQLPDVFAIDVIGSSFYYDWTDQGVVSPLPEDLSKWPTLQKYVGTDEIQALKKDDGKLYVIPRVMWDKLNQGSTERRTYYRWDLAQAAGVTKEPETYDEFRDMMRKIIAADPEKKNVTGLTVSVPQLFDSFFMPYGVPLGMGDGSGSDFKWIEKDGKFVPAYFNGDLQSVFQLARDMYTEKTVDPDVALAKAQLSEDKFLQGKVAAYFLNVQTDGLQVKWSKANPDKAFEDCVKIAKPFPMKDGSMTTVPVFKTYWSESYLGTKDPAKIEAVLGLYNWLLENDDTVRFGFEGEDWTRDGNTIVQKDAGGLGDKYPSIGLSGLVQYANWYRLQLSGDPATDKYRQMDLDYYDWVDKNTTVPEFNAKCTNLSTPTKNQFAIKPADDLIKVMTGTEPVEKMYKDLMDGYEKAGLSKMIEEVNAAMGK